MRSWDNTETPPPTWINHCDLSYPRPVYRRFPHINITNSFHTSCKQPLFCTISKSLPSQTKSMEVTHIHENCNNPIIIGLIHSKMRLQITRASWNQAFPSTQKKNDVLRFFQRWGWWTTRTGLIHLKNECFSSRTTWTKYWSGDGGLPGTPAHPAACILLVRWNVLYLASCCLLRVHHDEWRHKSMCIQCRRSGENSREDRDILLHARVEVAVQVQVEVASDSSVTSVSASASSTRPPELLEQCITNGMAWCCASSCCLSRVCNSTWCQWSSDYTRFSDEYRTECFLLLFRLKDCSLLLWVFCRYWQFRFFRYICLINQFARQSIM